MTPEELTIDSEYNGKYASYAVHLESPRLSTVRRCLCRYIGGYPARSCSIWDPSYRYVAVRPAVYRYYCLYLRTCVRGCVQWCCRGRRTLLRAASSCSTRMWVRPSLRPPPSRAASSPAASSPPATTTRPSSSRTNPLNRRACAYALHPSHAYQTRTRTESSGMM